MVINAAGVNINAVVRNDANIKQNGVNEQNGRCLTNSTSLNSTYKINTEPQRIPKCSAFYHGIINDVLRPKDAVRIKVQTTEDVEQVKSDIKAGKYGI